MKRVAEQVRHLSPAYFALVMATGILGIATDQAGLNAWATAFLILNLCQYGVLWVLTIYRYTFFRFSPGDLSPPYWINMGAMAISTLAGARLIENAPDAWFLTSLLPFLKGFTVFYWATGSWWIPMLVILAVWRHGYQRFPLTYDPLYWGALFPLGMYTVSTREMARAMHLDFLDSLPRVFIVLALGAWLLTFAGMLRALFRLFCTEHPNVALHPS